MATLTVLDIDQTGPTSALAAAAGGGDAFADDGDQRTFFEINNGGGGSINVTFAYVPGAERIPGYGVITLPDLVVAVGAGLRKVIGPFPRNFIDPATGLISVTYSGVTTVTVGARRLRRAEP